jgi:hypothetical protein
MIKKWVVLCVFLSVVGLVVMSGCASQEPASQTPAVPSVTGTPGSQVSSTLTIKPTTQVTIPVEGAFVKVSYIGGFSGTYGVDGVMQKVRNSGDRVYELTNETGNFSATFSKEDGSTKHDLTVELWKNGKSLTSAKNSTAFGIVSINYTL